MFWPFNDAMMVSKDIKVTVSSTSGGTCTVTVLRAPAESWIREWQTLLSQQIDCSRTSMRSYNGGRFERHEIDGKVIVLATPLFILMVCDDHLALYGCTASPARLVVGDERAWAVECVPVQLHAQNCTGITTTCLWSLTRHVRCDDIISAWNVAHSGTVLDARWDVARGSILCLVSDSDIVSYSLRLAEICGTGDLNILATFRNEYFRSARGIAATFLHDSTTSFVCALRMASTQGYGVMRDRLDAHSVFLCDSRTRDEMLFFRGATISKMYTDYGDCIAFTHTTSNYVFLQQFEQTCGIVRNSQAPRYMSNTRMHIFDLRTMTCVDTVEAPLIEEHNAHVRMVPRVVGGGSSSTEPAITIDALLTRYDAALNAGNRVQRVPVRTSDGRIWDPLGAFPAFPPAQMDPNVSTLRYGHPGNPGRWTWAP